MSLARLVSEAAAKHGAQLAIASPFERIKWSYAHLDRATRFCANTLTNKYQVQRGSVVVCDLPNVVANLVVQVACSRLGATFATVREGAETEALATARPVQVAVSAALSWAGRFPRLDPRKVVEVPTETSHPFGDDDAPFAVWEAEEAAAAHATFFGVDLTSADLEDRARRTVARLDMVPTDVVCVATSVSQPFGLGNGVAAAFLAGAAIVLPSVGGLRGTGDTRKRASATLMVIQAARATLLVTDAEAFANLPVIGHVSTDEGQDLSKSLGDSTFRGGLVRLGPGSDFRGYEDLKYWGGAPFVSLGSKEEPQPPPSSAEPSNTSSDDDPAHR